MTMHAITLWQPWAAAIAFGDKKVETRGRHTNARGLLAIHSAKVWGPTQREAAERLRLLIGKPASYFTDPRPANRRGVFVAVARLARCEEMTDELISKQAAVERVLGGWEPGRSAWFLEDVIALEEPLSLRGQQWLWTLPTDVEVELRKRAGLPELELK